jgi:hypothetical protein
VRRIRAGDPDELKRQHQLYDEAFPAPPEDVAAEHARAAYYAETRGQDVTHLCPRDAEDDMA